MSDRVLTEEVGVDPTDIIFDPNVFAVATGIDEFRKMWKTIRRFELIPFALAART